jgi:hypothetical protein
MTLTSTLTLKTGTLTSEGLIPHLDLGGLLCPVKLDISHAADPIDLGLPQAPLRDADKRLIYALPGGGHIAI